MTARSDLASRRKAQLGAASKATLLCLFKYFAFCLWPLVLPFGIMANRAVAYFRSRSKVAYAALIVGFPIAIVLLVIDVIPFLALIPFFALPYMVLLTVFSLLGGILGSLLHVFGLVQLLRGKPRLNDRLLRVVITTFNRARRWMPRFRVRTKEELLGFLLASFLFVSIVFTGTNAALGLFLSGESVLQVSSQALTITGELALSGFLLDVLEHFFGMPSNIDYHKLNLPLRLWTFLYRFYCSVVVIEVLLFSVRGNLGQGEAKTP